MSARASAWAIVGLVLLPVAVASVSAGTPAPTGLVAAPSSPTTLHLAWDAPANPPDGYNLTLTRLGQAPASFALAGNATSFDLAADPCAGYDASLVARSTQGDSSPATAEAWMPACDLWYDASLPLEANGLVRDAAHPSPGGNDATMRGGANLTGGAFRFDGASATSLNTTTLHPGNGPDVYTIEARFRTTATHAGLLVSYQNSQTAGSASQYDRHLFLDAGGRVGFGVWIGGASVIKSDASYNDGAWHTAIVQDGAAGSANGTRLFVDGQLVNATAENREQPYAGWWIVGSGSTGSWEWTGLDWPAFAGDIAEVKIFATDAAYAAPPAVLQSPEHLALARGPALGEASLSWVEPAWGPAPDRFEVRVRNGTGALVRDLDVGLATNVDVTGLQPGSYSWNVTAIRGGEVAASAPLVGAPAQAPSPPTALAARSTQPGHVDLSWGAPADDGGAPVARYDVAELDANATPVAVASLSGSSRGASLAVPQDGATHVYLVRANTSAANSTDANVSFVAAWPPDPVASLWSTPGDAVGSVNLTWVAPAPNTAPIASYQVWRDGAIVAQTNATNLTDAGLSPGARHAYNVTARSANGTSAPGASITEVARPVPIACPQATSVSIYGCEEIPVALYPRPANATVPTNMRCDDCVSSPLALPFAFPMFGRVYQQVNVTTNGLLLFGSTASGWSYSPFGIPTQGSPSGLVAGYWSDLYPVDRPDHVHAWTVGEAPSRVFVVEWAKMPEFASGPGNATFQVALHEDTGAVEYQIPFAAMSYHSATVGLEDETGTYGLTIYNGRTPLVGQAFLLTPPAGPPLSAPAHVSAAPTGSGQITVRWSPAASANPSGVYAYRVYRAPAGGNPALVATASGTSYVDAGLAAGRYSYWVAAVNARGDGPMSEPANATAYVGAVPTAPTLALDPAQPTGLGGAWNATLVANATSADPNATLDILDSFDGASHPPSYAIAQDGLHTLTARSLDAHGSVVAASSPVDVLLDATPPTLVGARGGTPAAMGATLNFSEPMDRASVVAALHAPSCALAWNATSDALLLSSCSPTPGDEAISLGTNATDAHGNHLARPFALSLARPAVALDPASPSGLGGAYNASVVATATARDGTGALVRLRDAADGTARSTPFSVGADGEHSLVAEELDAWGDVVAASDPVSFTIDATPPTASLARAGTPDSPGATIAFDEPMDRASVVDALDAAGCEIAWDETSSLARLSACTGLGVGLGTGATDAHGNHLAAPLALSFAAPGLVLDPATTQGNGGAGVYNRSVLATGVAADGTGDEVRIREGNDTTLHASPYLVTGDGLHNLTAVELDADGHEVANATAQVTLDTLPPTATLAATTDERGARVDLRFSEPMDTAATLAALVGAQGYDPAWSADNATLTLRPYAPLPGDHDIGVGTGATDAHGNHLTQAVVASRHVDAPALALDPAQPGGLNGAYNASVVARASMADAADVRILDDADGALHASPYAPGDGGHTLRAQELDRDGRVVASSAPVAMLVDTAAPTLVTGVWRDEGQLTVAFNFSEPMDAASTLAALAGAHPGEASLDATRTQLRLALDSPGPRAFTLGTAATDAHGNHLAHPASATLPGAAPTLALDPATPQGHGAKGVYNESVVATATGESGARVDILDSFDNASHPSPYAIAADGTHTLTARTLDADGHPSAAAQPVTIQVDRTPPTVASTGAQSGGTVTFVFSFSEPMDAEATQADLALPAGFAASWSEDGATLTIAGPGSAGHTYVATVGAGATDAHGNHLAAPASRSVAIPAPPPAERVPGAPATPTATYANGVIHVAWSAPADPGTKPVATYRLLRAHDGAASVVYAGGATSFDDRDVAPGGTYIYSVSAASDAGEGPRSGAASVAVPLVPPTSTVATTPATPDGANGFWRTAPTVALAAAPAEATISWSLDGAAGHAYSGPIAVPEGHHLLRWHASEPGAPDEAERSQTFDVDATPPVLDDALIAPATLVLGNATTITAHAHDAGAGVDSVEASISDGTRVPLAFDGAAWRGSFAPHAAGAFAVSIAVRDRAGNVAQGSAGTLHADAPPAPAAPENATTPTPDAQDSTPTPAGGASSSPPSSSGGSGGTPLETHSVTPSTTSAQSIQPASAPPQPAVTVQQDPTVTASLSAGARGVVHVSIQNAPHPDRVTIVAIDADGHETAIGSGTEASWNTTQSEDGYYTIQARERQDDGSTVVLASTTVLVRNVLASAAMAAGSAAVGVGAAAVATVAVNSITSSMGAAAATATTSAAGSAGSAAGSAATSGGSQGFSLTQYIKDLFTDAGSDVLRDRTKDLASIERRRRIASTAALVVTVGLIAVFYTLSEANGYTWAAFVAMLPVVGTASVVLALEKYGTESLINHLSGARIRFRIWIAGIASLLVSTLVFKSPFGYPGYVDNGEEETEGEKRFAGHRALAILGSTAGWGLVFLLATRLGYVTLGNVGLSMALGALATACMPFGPLPGGEVWRWSKPASLAVAAAGLGLYIAYEIGMLPIPLLVAVGIVGLVGYAATTAHYARARRRPPHRVPVQDLDAERAQENAQSEHEATHEA